MQFRIRIEQFTGTLSPAEERMLKAILASPQEAALLTAAELATWADVHESTVVRFSQKLGYNGYREMRAELQAENVAYVKFAERLSRRLEKTPGITSFVDDEIAVLQELQRIVPQEQLDQAAALLVGAQRVFLFAHGNATTLLEMMGRRLRRSGFMVVELRQRGRDLAEHLLTLGPGDVVLAFAFHSRSPSLEGVLAHAHSVEAQSLLISDVVGHLVRPQPNLLIAARRTLHDQEEFQSLTVPMAICNALLLTIARMDQGRSISALERLTHLIRRFET